MSRSQKEKEVENAFSSKIDENIEDMEVDEVQYSNWVSDEIPDLLSTDHANVKNGESV